MLKNKKITGLYAISHHDQLDRNTLLNDAQALLDGGVRLFQFRDKTSSKIEKYERARLLKTLCIEYGCLLLVNDDVTLAADIDADGVHLGQKDTSLTEARKILGINKLIGQSCQNSLELALQAESAGADYIALGRFFSSQTKADAPQANIRLIKQVKRACNLPIVAIGGITLDNAASLLHAGADSLAVIHDLLSQADIKQQALAYQIIFQKIQVKRK